METTVRSPILLISIVFLCGCVATSEIENQVRELQFTNGGERSSVVRYAAPGDDPRPAVLILHGASGFSAFRQLYEIHAWALVDRGYRVYVVMYYNDADMAVINGSDRGEERRQLYRTRLQSWTDTVMSAVTYVSQLSDTDVDRIALLGFSQGGFLAIGVAGRDERIAAVVEKYGGLPSQFSDEVDQFPATLIIHGSADTSVPVQEAFELERFLRGRDAEYEIKIYENAGHGFDAKQDSADARDAVRQTIEFLDRALKWRS